MTVVDEAQVGDVVIESGGRVGRIARMGEVLELVGEAGHRQLRVRWEDGHESLYLPGSDVTIRHYEDGESGGASRN